MLRLAAGWSKLKIRTQSAVTETAEEPTITQQAATEEPAPTPIPATATAPPPTEEPQTARFPDLEEALKAVVEAQVAARFAGAILMFDAPDIKFSWQGAAGMAHVEGEVPLETDTPFRISGITNTMMAALML